MSDPANLAGGKLGEYGYSRSARGEERSAADVLKDIVGNVQEIVRSEVRLAKTELREEGGKTFDAGKLLLAGSLLGLYGLGFILLAVVYFLASFMASWLAALIVGVLVAGIAGVLVISGRNRLKVVNTSPKTIGTMKENIEWMKNQTRS